MEDWSKYDAKFRYMMLSRMKMDCDYYFGNGGRNSDALWAHDEKAQIENMIALWKSFDPEDRPEWMTWADIIGYANKMGLKLESVIPNYVTYFRKNREDDE